MCTTCPTYSPWRHLRPSRCSLRGQFLGEQVLGEHGLLSVLNHKRVSLILCHACDQPFPARAKRSNLARGGAQAMVACVPLCKHRVHASITLSSVWAYFRAHGDTSAPVACARFACFSANTAASLSSRQHHFLHHAVCMADRVSRIVAATHGEHVQILSPWLQFLHKIKHTCDRPFLHRAKRSKLARGGARAMIA